MRQYGRPANNDTDVDMALMIMTSGILLMLASATVVVIATVADRCGSQQPQNK